MADKVYRDVLLKPRARVAMARGVDKMANVLRVTLGPSARAVVMAPIISTRSPELLTDSATIARRIIEFPDPYENMGAMLIRHMAWRMREKAGSGAATAAVIAQALLHEANYQTAAGANVMMMKRGMERGLDVAYEQLKRLAVSWTRRSKLRRWPSRRPAAMTRSVAMLPRCLRLSARTA